MLAVIISVAIINTVIIWACLKTGSDEDDRMGLD